MCSLVLKLRVNALFLFFLFFLLTCVSGVSEVDECQISPYICGQGICYNTAEGYTCHCDEGYRLDEAQNTCVGKRSTEQSLLLRSNKIWSFSMHASVELESSLVCNVHWPRSTAAVLEAQMSGQIEFCKID